MVIKDEQEIIIRAASGDDKSFTILVHGYESMVYNLAYQITQSKEDAYDISQEVFLKLYKYLNRYDGTAKLSTWIYTITVNCARDYLRRNKKHISLSLNSYAINDISDGEIDPEDKSELSRPENQLLRSEIASEVRKAIAQLEENQRTVIVLRDMEGYSYADIAEMLGVDAGTVKSRIHRARENLKKLLKTGNFFK